MKLQLKQFIDIDFACNYICRMFHRQDEYLL